MKVSNGQVWEANDALKLVMKQPWPVKTAYWLAKLHQKLGTRVAAIDQVRLRLIREYGDADERGQVSVPQLLEIEGENGKKQQVPNPRWAEFVPFFNELMEEEDEVEVQPVVLPTDSGVKLLPEVLLPLLRFVRLEGQADEPEDKPAEARRNGGGGPPEGVRALPRRKGR